MKSVWRDKLEEIENYQVSVYTRIKNNDSFLIFAFREVVASPRNTPPVFHFIQETLIVSAGSGFAGAAVENLRLQKLVWSSRQKNKLSRSRKSCWRLLSVLPPSIPTFSIFNPLPPSTALVPQARTKFRWQGLLLPLQKRISEERNSETPTWSTHRSGDNHLFLPLHFSPLPFLLLKCHTWSIWIFQMEIIYIYILYFLAI